MNKTIPTTVDVSDFIAQVDSPTQREDSKKLVEIMQSISGKPPVMWGSSIIGFDKIHYKYASGREGDWPPIGFSPRKGKLALYITNDASRYKAELDAMGKYKIGKGCIYINKLADVDIDKLRKLIQLTYDNEAYLGAVYDKKASR